MQLFSVSRHPWLVSGWQLGILWPPRPEVRIKDKREAPCIEVQMSHLSKGWLRVMCAENTGFSNLSCAICTCGSSTWEVDRGRDEFKASLGCIVTLRPVWPT